MHADPHLEALATAPTRDRGAMIGTAVVLLLVWVLAVYGHTTYLMVSTWNNSATFAHGFVVIPIALYLLWRQRGALAAIEPRPFSLPSSASPRRERFGSSATG